MSHFVFLITAMFAANFAWAQTKGTSVGSITGAPLTKNSFSNSLELGFGRKNLGMRTDYNDKDSVEFNPNTPGSTALTWANRKLGLALTVTIGRSSSDDEKLKKIQTSYQDYQVRYFTRNFGFEVLYQDYQGFETEASNNDVKALMTDAEKNQSDLRIQNYQAQFDWAFQGVSSLELFGSSWEKPRQDGAGYYVIGTMSHTRISNPTSFLPQELDALGQDQGMKDARITTSSVGVGASYVWQWTNLYIAGLMSLQAGPQLQQFETEAGSRTDLKATWFPQFKAVVGYDWGRFYTNITVHYHSVRAETDDTKTNINSQDVGINFGSRF